MHDLAEGIILILPFSARLPAWRLGGVRLRFIDLQNPPMKFGSVQGGNDSLRSFIRDFHEAKTSALVGFAVETDAGADDIRERLHEFGQVSSTGFKGQVAKIQYLAHFS